MGPRPALALAAAALLAALPAPGRAQPGAVAAASGRPVPSTRTVWFNQGFVEGLYRDVDVTDPVSVFQLVFAELDDTVTVYPTENYYYFGFNASGRTYWGNLRLDATDRDAGVIHLGYFGYDDNGERQDKAGSGRAFSAADGVLVTKVAHLVYEVTYGGRSVVFRLNDLPFRPPAKAKLRQVEVFVGPIFDESGLQFALLYDRVRRHFLYVLNEDEPVPETFDVVKGSLLVGRRTGFAFWDDAPYDRKVLVAVHGNSTNRNNYYDGPFDQLPDNQAPRTAIQAMMQLAYPYVKGRIDEFGGYREGGSRVMVFAYDVYYDLDALDHLLECRSQSADEPSFYECLTPDFAQRIGDRFAGSVTGDAAAGSASKPSPRRKRTPSAQSRGSARPARRPPRR